MHMNRPTLTKQIAASLCDAIHTRSGLVPTELRFGVGAFAGVARLARAFGRRVLIVTTRSAMERLGYTAELVSGLQREGVEAVCFRDVCPNPSTDDVDHGAALARSLRADAIVALGGGSVIDCAKAIAAVAPGHQPAVDYLYRRAAVTPRALPVLAVPTTAGTGSEMNPSAIITDRQRRVKDGIRSPYLFPRYAIVDPELTRSASRELTAQTGFDALAHAIESYVSPKAQPDTDQLALQAMHGVCRFLPVALEDPSDRGAREQLALASTTMGINLATVGTCFPHRADKALCALHPEIAHGQSVALFYPYWARFSYRGNAGRFAAIAEILASHVAGLSVERRADAFADVITEFLQRIGLRRSLTDFGVTEEEVPLLADRVVGDLAVNPVPMERSRLGEVLLEIFQEGQRYAACD
jgi:alcohol dehydrogenase class IV